MSIKTEIATVSIKEISCYLCGDGSRAPGGDYPQSLHLIMDPGFYFNSLSLGLSLSGLFSHSVTWPTLIVIGAVTK